MYLCVLLLAFIVAAVEPQLLYEGSECRLKNGSIGECKPIQNCPQAFKELQGFHRTSSRNVRCSFDKYTEIICCPLSVPQTPSSNIDTSDGVIVFGNDDHQNNPWSSNWQTSPSTPSTVDFNTVDRLEAKRATEACEKFVREMPSSISLHILGGENAGPGEFPHMVALGYQKEDGLQFDCGGTLISERFILTAAHCVDNAEKILPTVARMGTVILDTKGTTSVTDYKIIKNIVHPQYRKPFKYNDIALLEIDKDADFSAVLYPACLNTDPEDPKGVLAVTGWGSTNIKKRSKSAILQKANLTAVDLLECNRTYTSRRDRKLPTGLSEDQMCAIGSTNFIDSCDGDSGGPLQVLLDPAKYEAMYKLVGITSFGRACGGGIPAVYVRISSYVEWIESIVWS